MARGLKLGTKKVEGLYCPCSECKGPDQPHGNRAATDLRLSFLIYKNRFSHDAVHSYDPAHILFLGSVFSVFFVKLILFAYGFRHYENTPIQYTVIFHGCKNDYFQMKNYDIFLIFAQNIDRGYLLEPPQ